MKITVPGKDIIVIDDSNVYDDNVNTDKVHLIRLKLSNPSNSLMDLIIKNYPDTNRFVIDSDHIRFYNYYLKQTNLKYYVINTIDNWSGIVTFFKKNNKVLLDITKLSETDIDYVFYSIDDILSNTEVILLSKKHYIDLNRDLDKWNGNVIIMNDNYDI